MTAQIKQSLYYLRDIVLLKPMFIMYLVVALITVPWFMCMKMQLSLYTI
jgi:hypothetical protein